MGSSSSGSKSGFSLGGSVLKIFVLTCKQKRFGVYFDNKDEIYIFLKTNKLFLSLVDITWMLTMVLISG